MAHKVNFLTRTLITLLLSFCAVAFENPITFDQYLLDVAERAKAEGVSDKTIQLAFNGLEADPRVIGFDRRQPEFIQTFDEYLSARVSDFRIREGRRLFKENRSLLDEVSNTYGVDPEYVVAFWGLETSFGRYQGRYSIIRSLATLGHDPRRSVFFTGELIKALQILDEGHVDPENFVGAWAGAMGQSQFMPSSFLNYAVDFDGDGKKDIWSNRKDVFASIANYLKKNNWQQGAGWGGLARLDTGINLSELKPEKHDTRCRALRQHTVKKKLSEWQQLGIGHPEGLKEQSYALIVPGNADEPAYFAGGNFRTILSYNCANKYAVSVGILADKIVTNDT